MRQNRFTFSLRSVLEFVVVLCIALATRHLGSTLDSITDRLDYMEKCERSLRDRVSLVEADRSAGRSPSSKHEPRYRSE
jgi:hypothetical protein